MIENGSEYMWEYELYLVIRRDFFCVSRWFFLFILLIMLIYIYINVYCLLLCVWYYNNIYFGVNVLLLRFCAWCLLRCSRKIPGGTVSTLLSFLWTFIVKSTMFVFDNTSNFAFSKSSSMYIWARVNTSCVLFLREFYTYVLGSKMLQQRIEQVAVQVLTNGVCEIIKFRHGCTAANNRDFPLHASCAFDAGFLSSHKFSKFSQNLEKEKTERNITDIFLIHTRITIHGVLQVLLCQDWPEKTCSPRVVCWSGQ